MRTAAHAKPQEPSKSELTRQRILDAAAKVFAERGYAHTRLVDVAQEAGSHAGGIYYYFASREALVDEVLRVSTQRSIDHLTKALQALSPDAGAVERITTAMTVQLSGIMARERYDLAHLRIWPQLPDELRVRHAAMLHRYFSIWRGIIAEGQTSGELRADLDPSVLRLTIAGAVQWASEWADTAHGSPEELAGKMAAIFLNGILVKPAS
jgi:AcrR family transcriptional regulator